MQISWIWNIEDEETMMEDINTITFKNMVKCGKRKPTMMVSQRWSTS